MLQKGQLVIAPEYGGTRIFTVAGYLESDCVEMQTGEQLLEKDCIPIPVHYNKPEYVRMQPHLRGDVFGILCNEAATDESMSEIMAEYERLQNEAEDLWDDSVEDWELLGLDPNTPQEEIDDMWDNQM